MVDSFVNLPIFHRMLHKLGNPLRRSLRRRLCAGVTLLAYIVAAIGFPLPAMSAKSPHACGQAVCGCGTAEQCKASGCGCSHVPEPPVETPGTCCSKKKPSASRCAPAKKAKSAPGRWVVGIAALKCQGGATQWVTPQAALPTAEPITWQPSWPFSHSVPILCEHPFLISADLLDPPPR